MKENLKDGVCLSLSATPNFAYIRTSASFKANAFSPLGQRHRRGAFLQKPALLFLLALFGYPSEKLYLVSSIFF